MKYGPRWIMIPEVALMMGVTQQAARDRIRRLRLRPTGKGGRFGKSKVYRRAEVRKALLANGWLKNKPLKVSTTCPLCGHKKKRSVRR